MKRKSGLHKKVSAIFGDIPLPENPSSPVPKTQSSDEANDKASSPGINIPDIEPASSPSIYQKHKMEDQRVAQSRSKNNRPLTEEDEYAADQRKKLLMVVGLAIVLAVVLLWQFYPIQKNNVSSATKTGTSAQTQTDAGLYNESVIAWQSPEPWPDDVRDPMAYSKKDALNAKINSRDEGPLSLKGVIYKTKGRSIAMIGSRMLYVGDKIDEWTVKDIQSDAVTLENAAGQEKLLEMHVKKLMRKVKAPQ